MRVKLFDTLLFLYFVTLHADQLNLNIAGFSFRFNNLIALSLLIYFVFRHRTTLFRIDRTLFRALLFLTTSVFLSFLLSPYKSRCCVFFGWYGFTLILYFLLPYLLLRFDKSEKIVRLYLFSFVFVGLYAAFQLVLSLVGIQDPFAGQFISGSIVRPNAFAYEPSYYALYFTPFVVMLNFFYLAEKKPSLPAVLAIDFLYFASTSTSAFIAFAFFVALLPFFSSVRKQFVKYTTLFVALFSSLAVLSPYLMRKFFLKFFYSGLMNHHSFFERWVGIENGWKIFLRHPFFGVGLGGYPPYLYDAFLAGGEDFQFLPWHHSYLQTVSNPLKAFEPTNVFLEIIASLGVVGVCAFLLFIGVVLKRAYTASRSSLPQGQALFLSLVVMLVVLQFNQGLFRTYIWVHLAFVFALSENLSSSSVRVVASKY